MAYEAPVQRRASQKESNVRFLLGICHLLGRSVEHDGGMWNKFDRFDYFFEADAGGGILHAEESMARVDVDVDFDDTLPS